MDTFPKIKIATIGHKSVNIWKPKYGDGEEITEEYFISNLSLVKQDSRGSIFNERRWVIGLNRKVEIYFTKKSILSFSIKSHTILGYLNYNVKEGIKEKWGFHKYSSYLIKNKSCVVPIGIIGAVTTVVSAIYDLIRTKEP